MSNLKKVLALSLVLALAISIAAGGAYSYTSYSDASDIEIVNGNYRLAADLLNDIGVVIGKVTPDTIGSGTTYMYDPKGDFDRATLARILYLLDSGAVENSISNNGAAFAGIVVPFKDIGDSWAANFIKYCYAKGLLSGRNSMTFDPTAPVTAQELATAMLALRGYKKADLSKNYPMNVVTYGYTIDCNLFDAGVSADASPDPVNVGVYLPGTKNAGGVRNFNAFKEFGLTEAMTREQAFYMVFNNLINGMMVMKLSGTATTAGVETSIVFDTYLNMGANYVGFKYGIDYIDYTVTGIVTGSNTLGMGSTKSGSAVKVKINSTEYTDYGYTATAKMTSNTAATGYTLSQTDWNVNIARKIISKAAAWTGPNGLSSGPKIWGYTFIWDEGNNDPGITGTDVNTTKLKIVSADAGKIKIDGTSYSLLVADSLFVSTNNAVVTAQSTLNDAITALKQGNRKSVDAFKFKLIDGKVYGVFAINTTWQKVTEVGTDGKIKTDLNTTATATNIAGLAVGDYILAYTDAADGIVKGTKATKSALTYITVGTGDAAGKYFINGITTQLIFGDANGVQVVNPSFIDDDDMYYIYTVGSYVYRVEEEAPHTYSEVLVTSKSAYDMNDGKWIYSFTGYVNGNPAQVVTYTTPVMNWSINYSMWIDEGDVCTVETTSVGVFVDIDDNTNDYMYRDEKASSIADVLNDSDHFYYDTANSILYVYCSLPGDNSQAVAIGPATKVYVLKSNYSASAKTLGDAAVQEVIVAEISNSDHVVTGTLIIAITNE